MSRAMDEFIERVTLEAKIAANTEAIKNIMESFGVDSEKAMDVLKIPLSERPVYAEMISQ